MSQSLYIATVGSGSGKSLAVLGVTELLSHRVRNVGFFRPVIRAGEPLDNDIELIRQRYHLSLPYEALYGATHQQARQMIADGQYQRLLKLILDKFKQVERQCDFVVCEGTDYTGLATAFDSEFDADVAKHLGASLLVVINGRGKASDEIVGVSRAAREAFEGQGCTIAATIVNRVRGQGRELLQQLRSVWPSTDPVYVLPEEQILFRPTVAEIVKALDGHVMYGETEAFNREVLDYKIAAMHLPNFLPQLVEGGLVITPGDRSDVILGTLAAAYSEHYPNVTGLILTGGLKPAPAVEQLIKDFHRPMVPIAGVQLDTFTAAMTANSVRAAIAPDNDRKIAMALGVFESHVDADELEKSISLSPSTWVTPLMFEYEMIERAKASRQHIVLPEGTDERILRASEILLRRRVVDITLLGNEREIRESITAMGLDLEDAHVIDPSRSALGQSFAETYFELRKHKGITPDHAHDTMLDVSYFGTMMVYKGLVNGMVSGAVHTTAHTIRPSFEFIKTQPGCSLVSSVFFMCLEDRVLVYGDCAVNPNPTPEQLADIAISSAGSAQMFGVEPRIAMLSYSTGQSGRGEDVAKVREATRIARQRRPDLKIEGPIQYDAAIDPEVARTKMPDSEIAGHATVFVFPDLNTGNNTYKAVQRSAGAVAVGPVLQGLKKPVNDLSRGCRVPDIVNTVAITAIQAQAAAKMVCGITL